MYSPTAWVRDGQRILNPSDPTTRRTVTVAGQQGELLSLQAGGLPVNQLVLVIQMGDTVVVARATAGRPAPPGGPGLNPLVDEQAFLAVMQNLRPYPQ